MRSGFGSSGAGPVILFVGFGRYAVRQQIPTAEYLRQVGGFRPHFLLPTPADLEHVPALAQAGLDYTAMCAAEGADEGGADLPSRRRAERLTRLLEADAPVWARWLAAPLAIVADLYRTWLLARQVKNRIQRLLPVLGRLGPACAVVPQERARETLPVVAALRAMRVPITLLLAAESSPDGSAWHRRDSRAQQLGLTSAFAARSAGELSISVLNRLIALLWPGQVYESRWGRMLFYSHRETLAYRLLGVLPRRPWYQGSTFADAIVISGSDEELMYAEANVPQERLHKLGNHDLDLLHEHASGREQLRSSLAAAYGLSGRPLALIALPPYWEHAMLSAEEQWRSFRTLFTILSASSFDLLVSLHPRARREAYGWIEEEFAARICTESLHELLPAADVFIASYSSTARWAAALGIPALNLDWWQLDWVMYRGLDSVRTVYEPRALEDALRGLSDGAPLVRDSIIVDGGAKHRFLVLMQRLTGAAALPDSAGQQQFA